MVVSHIQRIGCQPENPIFDMRCGAIRFGTEIYIYIYMNYNICRYWITTVYSDVRCDAKYDTRLCTIRHDVIRDIHVISS